MAFVYLCLNTLNKNVYKKQHADKNFLHLLRYQLIFVLISEHHRKHNT